MFVIARMLPLVVALAITPSHAQDYPSRSITIVVPFSAGGAVDAVARLMAQKLTERLGKPVVVDNKPGASGNIGAQAVVRATPDGYTLLMAAVTNYAINAPLYPAQVTYSLEKDLVPVALVGNVPLMLVVNPQVPATDLKQFIALAKANPGKYTYASSGNGSTEHLAGALFMKLAGIDMLHVPYKGGAPAGPDGTRGKVRAAGPPPPNRVPKLKGDRVRAVGIGPPARKR